MSRRTKRSEPRPPIIEVSTWEARRARQEASRLLRCIDLLTRELRSLQHRGGPDVDLKERELERLRWRLAAVARRTVPGDAGAAA
jgi:hypothetical protein